MNNKKKNIKWIIIGLLIPIIEISIFLMFDMNSIVSILSILIIIITIIVSLFFVLKKNKNIITKTIGKFILIMYVIIAGLLFICFPIYQRLYLQSRCNQFGTGYKLQKNNGKYPSIYYWVCVNSEGKAINFYDGNEVPELLNYTD